MDTAKLQALLQEASSLASSSNDLAGDEKTRTSLLRLCQQATGLLEQPDEKVAHLAHVGGHQLCVRIADDLDLFRTLCERPHTARELADATGADEKLIVRVLRVLSAVGFAAHEGNGRYGPTRTSQQMTMRSVRAGMKLKYVQSSTPSIHSLALTQR